MDALSDATTVNHWAQDSLIPRQKAYGSKTHSFWEVMALNSPRARGREICLRNLARHYVVEDTSLERL